ncbi:MAG: GGDEF domain-containing protein [Rubrivivax sp.]
MGFPDRRKPAHPDSCTEADRQPGDSAEDALSQADLALHDGCHPDARALAQSVLIAARSTGDLQLEARALSCLARSDSLGSRLRRAADTARRAAQLFQRLGDAEGETVVQNTLSHACMLLGRNDEAIEAALLSASLGDAAQPTAAMVAAHNCLGMAYCWSGNHDRSNAALDAAVHMAARCTPALSPYPSRLNQLWVEAARLADLRYHSGSMGGLQPMGRLIQECRRLEQLGVHSASGAAERPAMRTISTSMKGLFAAWRGDVANARLYADRALGSLGGTVTWLDALARWVVAEGAWSEGDWAAAEHGFEEMRASAVTAEHEQLACLAHLLQVQVLELQGKHARACTEMRLLRARERRALAEGVASREAAVRWQLGARQSELSLEQALEAAKRFERWSLEDPLTGMANRRAFERALTERLPAAVADGRSLSVAMVDVDRFKSVNDTHSHQIGDRVLQSVASVLSSSVREGDIAARLAGDEFVMLFSDADAAAATEICERIAAAVAGFDWESLASGLQVTISIGVSQAVEGDTIDTLVHRSDASMYSVKSGWAPTGMAELAA